MSTPLTPTDENYLRIAIELSRHALENEGKTPFGAILVIGEEIVSEGTSSVIELIDPSAHAEVMAIRNAARTLTIFNGGGYRVWSGSPGCCMPEA